MAYVDACPHCGELYVITPRNRRACRLCALDPRLTPPPARLVFRSTLRRIVRLFMRRKFRG